jgi:predicted RNase H-like HicB family nuclease
MTYGVIVHRAGKSWNAYVPDLDGVVATASTRERVIELISQAIPFHLRQLAEAGTPADAAACSEALTLVVPA